MCVSNPDCSPTRIHGPSIFTLPEKKSSFGDISAAIPCAVEFRKRIVSLSLESRVTRLGSRHHLWNARRNMHNNTFKTKIPGSGGNLAYNPRDHQADQTYDKYDTA